MKVNIDIKDDIIKLVNEMIELGISRSVDDAINLLIEQGRAKIEEKVKKELVNKWLKEGYPYNIDTSDLRTERL